MRPQRLLGGPFVFAAALILAGAAYGQQPATQKPKPGTTQGGTQPKPGTARPAPQQKQPQQATPAQTVDLDDLERHPDKYIGKEVAVEGEAADVLGPHLFTISEPGWFHLRSGMLVVVPEPFAAVVRRDAPVRVTGKVEKVTLAEARRRWSFLSDPKVSVDIFEKPALVADEVTTVAPTVVTLKLGPNTGDQPVGTSGAGAAGSQGTADLNQLASANDNSLVGRKVDVSGTVVRTEGDGFWVRTPSGDEVFVLPRTKTAVREGQTAEIRGTVLESPRSMKERGGKGKDRPVYVYADRVEPK